MSNQNGAATSTRFVSQLKGQKGVADALRALLQEELESMGYGVPVVSLRFEIEWPDAAKVKAEVATKSHAMDGRKRPDVFILDLAHPALDRLPMYQQLSEANGARIIVLNVSDGHTTQPFAHTVYLDEVRAVFQNGLSVFEREKKVFSNDTLSIDFFTREVKLGDDLVQLTPTEYSLLDQLASNVGRAMTQQELLLRVWGPEYSDAISTLKVHIQHLRRKLQDDPEDPHIIATERGIGYKFIAKSS